MNHMPNNLGRPPAREAAPVTFGAASVQAKLSTVTVTGDNDNFSAFFVIDESVPSTRDLYSIGGPGVISALSFTRFGETISMTPTTGKMTKSFGVDEDTDGDGETDGISHGFSINAANGGDFVSILLRAGPFLPPSDILTPFDARPGERVNDSYFSINGDEDRLDPERIIVANIANSDQIWSLTSSGSVTTVFANGAYFLDLGDVMQGGETVTQLGINNLAGETFGLSLSGVFLRPNEKGFAGNVNTDFDLSGGQTKSFAFGFSAFEILSLGKYTGFAQLVTSSSLFGTQVTRDIFTPVYIRANILGAAGAIPEPASWSLMVAGFGMIGAAMRRRMPLAV